MHGMFRYLEAGELNTSLKDIPQLKFNDTLTITSLLVKRYEKNIPAILKQKYDRHPIKCVYKNTGDLVIVTLHI